MPESLLAEVMEEQALATQRVLVRWKRRRVPKEEQDRIRAARELGRLIADHVANNADVRKTVAELVTNVTDSTTEQIDHVHAFLQKHLELIVGIGRVYKDLASKFASAGHKVKGLDSLDDAIAEWQRLREDLPERLALASRPVRSALRKRIANSLETTQRETDWRSLFK
jgi:hypothetical protein